MKYKTLGDTGLLVSTLCFGTMTFHGGQTGLLVWSPLAGGLLSGKFSRENQKPDGSRRSEFDFPLVDKDRVWKILDVIAPIAKAHGCSAARISLAWLLAKPVVTSVIIGAKRLDQLQDNLAAVEIQLTEEEIKQLDEISALPPEYPGWMLPRQSANRLEPAAPILAKQK
jgi:aryl-alcohol dehydrogenase-like predicted oxidoreductase